MANQKFDTVMDSAAFEASVKESTGFPDTRQKRFTLSTLSSFIKYEVPTLPAKMSLREWWDIFNDACSERACG